jgi:hypothetical protein
MQTEDRVVDITKAAEMLGTSKDWLYRKWKKWPFAVKGTENSCTLRLRCLA